ncbi:MAG: hypothetical protein M5U14_01885 [Acidimicrobiia bacterium]|nr:hypothetical protein [Acidimicrobiia bacterium]
MHRRIALAALVALLVSACDVGSIPSDTPGGAGSGGMIAQAQDFGVQANLRRANTAAQMIYAETWDVSAVTTDRLSVQATGLRFVTGVSNGPDDVSVAVTLDRFVAAGRSGSGRCLVLAVDWMDGALRSGERTSGDCYAADDAAVDWTLSW